MNFTSLTRYVPFSLALTGLAISAYGFGPGFQGGGQAAVASKTAKFATIAAKSPEFKKALEAKDLAGGLKLAGKEGSFTGTLKTIYSPRNLASVYLDFSDPYKNTISGQVLATDFAKFPVLTTLLGKRVVISGKFFVYQRTHPEVAITSLSGIKLVK